MKQTSSCGSTSLHGMSGDPIGVANKKKEQWLSNSRQIREEKSHCLLHGTMLPASKETAKGPDVVKKPLRKCLEETMLT